MKKSVIMGVIIGVLVIGGIIALSIIYAKEDGIPAGMNKTLYCISDNDCVPDSCCHPRGCVAKANAPVCKGIMCTLECALDSLDCGHGSCKCLNNQCRAVLE
jgi:hypothetical protein